ncbi:hypothetical protein AAG906_001625 [Vitis piasezkii]
MDNLTTVKRERELAARNSGNAMSNRKHQKIVTLGLTAGEFPDSRVHQVALTYGQDFRHACNQTLYPFQSHQQTWLAMLRDIMGRWVLKAPNPIHVTVGGQQHKAFLGSIRGNFSVRQQRDLTIWFIDSFTALIPKWGLRPRRVDLEVDALMGFLFPQGLSPSNHGLR